MTKCALTFDYELFLGASSGSVKRSLIEPTDRILEVLERHGAQAVFFVDASYLMRSKSDSIRDFELIQRQICKIVEMGSDVQLHIHPQWLDATYVGKEWRFESFEKYRLHSLSRQDALEHFCACKALIEDITQRPVNAFRAGGWCVQPFELLNEAFSKTGILLDSSVTPGLYKNALPHHFFDFRNVPSKSLYRFSTDPTYEDVEGKYLQLPVSTHTLSGFKLVLNTLLLKSVNNSIFGDGKGLYKVDSQMRKFQRIFQLNTRPFSVESLYPSFFKAELGKLLKQDRALLCLVMHPKTFTEVALENLNYICSRLSTVTTEDLIKRNLN